MRARVIAILILTALLVSGTTASAAPGHGRVVTVATDPAGDWASDIAPQLAPVGDPLGQDLVAATIAAHPSTIDFSLVTTSLTAEAAKAGAYSWDMRVDGKWWRLVSFVCDPTQYVTDAGPKVPESCAPEQGEGTYFEVMECGGARVVNIFANCDFRASVEAIVDTAAATITVPIATEIMGITAGSVIRPMAPVDDSIGSGLLLPYAGAPAFPADNMKWKKAYRVP